MRKAILAVLALVSSSAMADWVEVAGNEATAAYADPATIRRVGDMVKMRHLLDYMKARGIEGIEPYRSITMQDEYDCGQARTRTLSISIHSGNMGEGAVLGTSSEPGKWRPVAPGTLVETLREFACWKQ